MTEIVTFSSRWQALKTGHHYDDTASALNPTMPKSRRSSFHPFGEIGFVVAGLVPARRQPQGLQLQRLLSEDLGQPRNWTQSQNFNIIKREGELT